MWSYISLLRFLVWLSLWAWNYAHSWTICLGRHFACTQYSLWENRNEHTVAVLMHKLAWKVDFNEVSFKELWNCSIRCIVGLFMVANLPMEGSPQGACLHNLFDTGEHFVWYCNHAMWVDRLNNNDKLYIWKGNNVLYDLPFVTPHSNSPLALCWKIAVDPWVKCSKQVLLKRSVLGQEHFKEIVLSNQL